MSSGLNRPIIRITADGSRMFAEPSELRARVTLSVSLFSNQTRAELVQWEPCDVVSGHVVWQHHIRSSNAQDGAARAAAQMLGQTAEWLSRQGWPGISL